MIYCYLSFVLSVPIVVSSLDHREDVLRRGSRDGDLPSNCTQNGSRVNCSSCSLAEVPKDLPANITVLDLSLNRIESLNDTLSGYPLLAELYLRRNMLKRLSVENFRGLQYLRILDLRGNKLTMNNGSVPSSVFAPLMSLTSLKLNGNTPHPWASDLSYPDDALSDLVNVSVLWLDGLTNKTLGPGFKKLAALRTLKLGSSVDGFCFLEKLQGDTFANVPQIEALILRDCSIAGTVMDARVFEPLQNLLLLDVSRNDEMHLGPLEKALVPLRHSGLLSLKMHNVVNPYSPCTKVADSFADSLPRNLTELVASSNSLSVLGDHVLDLLPKSLRCLDLSDNRLTFGAYLKNFSKLTNLETLKLNGGTQSFDLPSYYPPSQQFCSCQDSYHHTEPRENLTFKLPPNLRYVEIEEAGWAYSITEFHIDPENSLETLSLAGNYLPKLVGPLTGLNKLKVLNMSNCDISDISDTFFRDFASLESLILNANIFGSNILKTKSKPIFHWLANLKELDLSFTDILTIDRHVFSGLNGLERLHLQKNGVYYFNVDASHMKNLSFMNFSLTELSKLNMGVTDFLDDISRDHSVTIDFSENPITCDCSNLAFIEWITRTPVTLVNTERYKCIFDDRSEQYTSDFAAVQHRLVRECIPNVALFVSVAAATCLTCVTVAGMLLYRFRWKLRYLYYSAYIYYKGRGGDARGGGEFKYDVFVSYAHQDEEFVARTLSSELTSRGLKLFIHGLDFCAGDYISSNIVNAVNICRRTLVILSKHLLDSTWCRFEMQMANMKSVHTGSPVLVFLVMEPLNKQELGTELLYHIQNNTYIQIPDADIRRDPRLMGLFWTKLASDLKS
ncbi:unnamed protein product [Lymnaea stagnalis]|uniref:TIR domain-containing protein n=1 Tax=Lymnaea stagnalis TaxID=6523 RepID=A0AAV2ICU0_LYMST